MDRRWEISDEIQNIPATTEAGRIAKALVAIVLLRESDLFSSGATTFAFATLLNVAGIVAPKSIPIQSPCSDDTTDEDLLGGGAGAESVRRSAERTPVGSLRPFAS